MVIYSKEYDYNVTEDYTARPLLHMISNLMPCVPLWDEDDGDDIPDTTYCQYTYYEAYSQDNYLLASWCEIDEETGCMKL